MITSYAWSILWHERRRYLAAVMAVAFSTLLIAVQTGLLLGMFKFASLPVDHAPLAQIWVGGPNLVSVDLGRPMPENYLTYLAAHPEVSQCEIYIQGFSRWLKPDGASELCIVVGSRINGDALGAMEELTPELRGLLAEPGSIVLDESDLEKLGIQGVGDIAHVAGTRVRVVGVVNGFRGMAGAYVFCSIETAKSLLQMQSNEAVYLLGRCHNAEDAPSVVASLRRQFPELSSYTATELSLRSRIHWLLKTKAGLALGFAAALGLFVGSVVTSQTLYGATAASLREYAVLWSLGIPMVRMGTLVLTQSFWIGITGILLALPATFGVSQVADSLGLSVSLPNWLLGVTVILTLTMTLFSGLLAMRLIWRMEPAVLLR